MARLKQSDFLGLALAAVCACLLAVGFTLATPSRINAAAAGSAASNGSQENVLRVCADPNNLPFTNQRGEGFENKIAELLAADMHARVEYTWWRQTRTFFRNTLDTKRCDVVLGVPSRYPKALETAPYYTSSYVFVARKDRRLHLTSLDDPRLRKLKIGLHLINDDDNTPAAVALQRRGIRENIRWYSIYGEDYSQPNPPAKLLEAVAKGDVDVAIVWGPLAGYFAPKESAQLKLTPVQPQVDYPALPFVYSIAMGVRKGDEQRKAALEAAIARNRARMDQILHEYGVPRIDEPNSGTQHLAMTKEAPRS